MGLFSKKSSDSVKEAADAVRKLSISAAKPKVDKPAEVKAEPAETIEEEKGKLPPLWSNGLQLSR